jgi:hypothetical protein
MAVVQIIGHCAGIVESSDLMATRTVNAV